MLYGYISDVKNLANNIQSLIRRYNMLVNSTRDDYASYYKPVTLRKVQRTMYQVKQFAQFPKEIHKMPIC